MFIMKFYMTHCLMFLIFLVFLYKVLICYQFKLVTYISKCSTPHFTFHILKLINLERGELNSLTKVLRSSS